MSKVPDGVITDVPVIYAYMSGGKRRPAIYRILGRKKTKRTDMRATNHVALKTWLICVASRVLFNLSV